MSESLRNDGRVWVPKTKGDTRAPGAIPERRARLLPRAASTRPSATWCPATSPPGPPRRCATRAAASGPAGLGVYLDFADAIGRSARRRVEERYGNLFDMYQRITARTRTRCRCESTRPSTTRWAVCGSTTTCRRTHPRPLRDRRGQLLRPRRQPPRRVGAHAGPGRRLLRPAVRPSATTWPAAGSEPVDAGHPESAAAEHEVQRRIDGSCRSKGKRTVDSFHRSSAHSCGSTAAWRAPRTGCARRWSRSPTARGVLADVNVPGSGEALNQELEKAGRVADFLELGELCAWTRCTGRSPAAATSARRARRRTARRSATTRTSPRRRLGVHGRGRRPRPAQGTARLRVRRTRASGATSDETSPRSDLAAGAAPSSRAGWSATRSTTSAADMSFLEMLDVLNEGADPGGRAARAFDHDCREGICGSCGVVIDGLAHGPDRPRPPASCTCAASPTAMRSMSSRGAPRAFPVLKDLIVDRSRVRPDHPGRRLHHRPDR